MFQRLALLVVAEVVVFARHTVTQLMMSVGWTGGDWSSWYRLFSLRRFPSEAASAVLLAETLQHVQPDEAYEVAGDSTQTRRSSRKMEGAHWLHNGQAFNDTQVAARSEMSPAETLAEYEDTHRRTMRIAHELPAARFTVTGLLPDYGEEYDLQDYIAYAFYGHKREHSAQIAVFRDGIKR